jgi:hypothetical protein
VVVPPSSGAAGPNRAAVIVETPEETHRVLIEFEADSVSGLEALELAGADPSVATWSGMGGAVCALYGIGHPATQQDCLGTPSDPRFWAYWHVPAGSSGFDDDTFSRAGGSSVRVRDGDVEGWRFGTGEPPTWVSFASLVPPPPPPPPPAAPPATRPPGSSSPTVGPVGAPSGSSPGTVGTTTTTRRNAAPSGTRERAEKAGARGGDEEATNGGTRAGSTSKRGRGDRVESTGTTREREALDSEQASANRDGTGGSGSAWPLVGFTIVMLVLGVAIYVARRARVGRTTAGP